MERPRNPFRGVRDCGVVLCALAVPCTLPAATYTVGNNPALCDFADVQLAVNAARANPGADTIRVAAGTYPAQAIVIDSQALTLEGGYASCTAASPTTFSTLSGAGGSADSVLTVTGSGNDVRLRHLHFVGGDEVDDGNGGGLQLAGGQVVLTEVEIANNRAGYGGGIYASGVTLVLGSNVRVIGNTARHSGGGIRLTNASLRADADAIYIGFNEAEAGNGGGIALRSSVADLGSPGIGTLPMLHANRAAYGAALAILTGDLGQGPSRVRMYTTDASRPMRVSGNIASALGGVAYLQPSMDVSLDSASATLCASDFRFDDNVAVQGSALYADSDYSVVNDVRGSSILLNPAGDCDGAPARPPQAQRCSGHPGCGVIEHHGTSADAAVVLVQNAGVFEARDVIFRDNVGGHLVRVFGDVDTTTGARGSARIESCLIAGNTTQSELFRMHDAHARLTLIQCTLAANAVGGGALVRFNSSEDTRFTVLRSLLSQPTTPVLDGSPGQRVVADLVSHELASLPGAERAVQADARFFDPDDGDFRLQAASPAVDFAVAQAGTDLAAQPRTRDLPRVPDRHGTLDLGAFERQEIGNLVRNPEFPERADAQPEDRLWTATSTYASWSPEDAAGGRGSIYVSHTPDITPGRGAMVTEIFGLTQCVHLPGPGRYLLTASTRVPGNNALTRDYPSLDWVLRTNDASCSGPADLQGRHFLARSTSWSRAEAAAIDLATEAWTRNSTLQITLRVGKGGQTATSTIDAYFDAVSLVPDSGEVAELFRDGFEGP